MKSLVLLGLAVLSAMPEVHAQTSGVVGDWREPTGSVIRIAPCGNALCATLVLVSSAAPVRVDVNNPDAALRTRPLCGLQIGQGFRASDPNRAEGGNLYDPKNGKTYKGNMTSEGNTLLLRGYIGISLFGRTAKWHASRHRCKAALLVLARQQASHPRASRRGVCMLYLFDEFVLSD